MADILVVDDEPLQRGILKTILSAEGHQVVEADSAERALEQAETFRPALILTDLKMPGMTGIDLISALQERGVSPPPSVIIMTAFGTISSAVEAMKQGAFDYLTKPLDKDALLVKVRRALERRELLEENTQLHEALYGKFRIEGIVGESATMSRVLETLKKAAPTNATVLICGESGTGKELIARAVHYNSPRRKKSFTAINCASIPENLLESELFGYEPGAFTGAVSRKKGLIELTDGGTLFLDEIGDMPIALQAKLLRVLQDGEVRRIGGKESFRVDIRTVAATHRDLEDLIHEKRFREDLYYRLRVVTLRLPPLRERREDVAPLSAFFLDKYNDAFGKRLAGIDPEALDALRRYSWPGNIRQLESVIERAVIMCEGDTITYDDIREDIGTKSRIRGIADIEIPEEGLVFEEVEKALMTQAMEKTGHVVKSAAELLGMSYKTFWYRWDKFGLGKDRQASPQTDDENT